MLQASRVCKRYPLAAALAGLVAGPAWAAEPGVQTVDLVFNLGTAAFALGFALLHGLIFLFYPRERGNLWFSLFAFALVANGILDTTMTWGALEPWQKATLYQLNIFVVGGMLLALTHFLASLSAQRPARALRFLAWSILPAALVFAIPPIRPFHLPAYLAWILTAATVAFSSAVSAWRERTYGAASLLISAAGFVILIGGEAAKLAGVLGLWSEVAVHGLGLLLILGGASLLLARRLARSAWELERLASELENRVVERTAELRESELAALAASRAKSAFLATMSHEIRTPMNAIVGLAELLAGAGLSGREREMAATLRRSAVALLQLIDEVLDLSRIEAGRLVLERKPFLLEKLVREVGELFAPQAERSGVAFSWRLLSPTPPAVIGDPARLRQVLVNLVGNALKFTTEGSVELRAWAEGERLRLEVVDTGIGIAPEAIERLFQPFAQADETTTRRFGGAGLGLAISRRLVEAMGGTIEVESELGRGSTFRVHLPLETTPLAPPVTSSSQEILLEDLGLPGAKPLRILLAEDNEVNQLVTNLMLERLGQKATTVERGDAALELLGRDRFDLVLLDLHMPGLDGLDVARELRRRGDATWLVALTASALPEDRERCRESGMNDFLAKPVQLENLREALRRAEQRRANPSA